MAAPKPRKGATVRVVLGPDREELDLLKAIYKQMRLRWHTESDDKGSDEDIFDAYVSVREFYKRKGRKH